MADYDRDGFLDLYLCVYSYFFGAGEDKAGTPAPYYDARNGPPGVLFRNDGHGRFIEATHQAGLDAGNDRYHFAAAWSDYDHDGWPDLLVANDFGTKNLYRNRGRREGQVTFEDVAAKAGILDHGAGMSATFFDYDNDGLLDIYTGNMWSASGLRVTSAASFMPDASPEVRALYRRHARGNSLFRNRGDGGFDEKTLDARVEMGRWAWSSDVFDFDSDGWEDIYVVNGMLTRSGLGEAPAARASGGGAPRALREDARGSEPGRETVDGADLESFFWRQVVARSPLTRSKDMPYDDAWRAINQLLIHGSIASRQRNVFLRNDGQGGFDDISGSVGLDLDQDGRSFSVLDIDRDGDPDVAIMAARQAPQLRVFRNDFAPRGASLSVRLVGTASNRDAIGARVSVETDRVRRTKIVQAGSGFLSQHSKELLFGLGRSQRLVKLTVEWPSGTSQVFTDVSLNSRLRLVEGKTIETEKFAAPAALNAKLSSSQPVVPPDATWFYEPFPAPDFSLPDVRGETRSLPVLKGRPAIILLWSSDVPAARAALDALGKGSQTLAQAGISALAIALDPPADLARVRAASPASVPTILATPELGLSYSLLNRHLFMNRQDLRLPAAFLLDTAGRVVRAYRNRVDVSLIVRDAGTIEAAAADRLARAVPFPGTFYSPPGRRNYLPYGRELLDQGLEDAAIVAFDRAAQSNPSGATLYRLGTLLAKTGETERARASFERALALQPDLAEAHNDLGALLAQGGDVAAAIEHFRAAIASTPEYPDALNNLGYALLLTGHDADARALYEKALALQPDFPEALNNLGLLLGRAGELEGAERLFRDALARREDYGEAANNLALVLVARDQAKEAIGLLDAFLAKAPQFEAAYVTLAKIHFNADRPKEGIAVLQRLLQRNPKHPVALELLQQVQGPIKGTVSVLLQLLQVDVPELDLHRWADMDLEAQQPFQRPPLGVVVDEQGCHLTVDHVDDGAAARDQMHIVPVAGLDDCFQLVGLSLEIADHFLATVSANVDGLTALHQKAASAFLVDHAGVLIVVIDIRLISLQHPFAFDGTPTFAARRDQRAAELDAAVGRVHAKFEFELEVGRFAAAPDDECIFRKLVRLRRFADERPVLGSPVRGVSVPVLHRPVEDRLEAGTIVEIQWVSAARTTAPLRWRARGRLRGQGSQSQGNVRFHFSTFSHCLLRADLRMASVT